MRPDNDPVDHCQRRPGGSPVRNLLVQVHEGRIGPRPVGY